MEKEYLFYKLCKEVKKQVNSINYLYSDAKTEKINSIVGTLTTMSEETLELVLTVFSKLTTYNPDNIFFITGNSDLLKSIFFKDGNIIEEKLGIQSEAYKYLSSKINGRNLYDKSGYSGSSTLIVNKDSNNLEIIVITVAISNI